MTRPVMTVAEVNVARAACIAELESVCFDMEPGVRADWRETYPLDELQSIRDLRHEGDFATMDETIRGTNAGIEIGAVS